LQLLTTQGKQISLETQQVNDFRATLRGEVLLPTDHAYESARKVYNAMIDKNPSLIVRCANAADVVNAVRFARKHGLLAAVRGGGHNVAGNAVCDGGLMIDLSPMKEIHVDRESRRALAGPGLRLGEFDQATQVYELATPLGIVSNTGIAGLTLGGGIGWLNGKFGLACDNLLSVEVVTADGQLLRADPDVNQDLFWAVRGGGGNFGVVTSFEYKLHPVGPVVGGMLLYPIQKARQVLSSYDTFARRAPDELTTAAALLTSPTGDAVVAVLVCYSGPVEEADNVLSPFRTFAPPLADLIRPMKYLEMQSLLDESYPPGRLHYWKSSFIRGLSEEAIDTMIRYHSVKPSPLTAIVLQQVHGAAARVDPAQTAFPHRRNQYDFEVLSQWTDQTKSEENVQWTRKLYESMQPFLERDVYVNSLGEEGEDRVRAAYGQNYDRLVDLKRKYDPTNLFRMNQNIRLGLSHGSFS
jgi:FAD/FMN-containing dehydrogenase